MLKKRLLKSAKKVAAWKYYEYNFSTLVLDILLQHSKFKTIWVISVKPKWYVILSYRLSLQRGKWILMFYYLIFFYPPNYVQLMSFFYKVVLKQLLIKTHTSEANILYLVSASKKVILFFLVVWFGC